MDADRAFSTYSVEDSVSGSNKYFLAAMRGFILAGMRGHKKYLTVVHPWWSADSGCFNSVSESIRVQNYYFFTIPIDCQNLSGVDRSP